MSSGASPERFLTFYETYARQPLNKVQNLPKAVGDFRERVDRETVKGRYGVFHDNIEMYLYRHWRAFTCPRVALFWFGSFSLMQHGIITFQKTFPNVTSYKGGFTAHPNYKLLGPVYSWFYLARPIFWTYICARMTRFLYHMIARHWAGKDDQHYFMYYDTLYPDLLHDSDDMRYINFRYTDQKVSPEQLTGYYPFQNIRYGEFLNKKEDSTFANRLTSAAQMKAASE